MRVVVADASALVEYLLRTESAAWVEDIVRAANADLHVPALCDVEVTAALRQGLLRGVVSEQRAGEAIDDYLDLPLTRHGHQGLLARIVSLRENFSAYDAAYVALAERIGGGLLTADEPLSRAVRAHTKIVVVEPT